MSLLHSLICKQHKTSLCGYRFLHVEAKLESLGIKLFEKVVPKGNCKC